MLWSQFGETFLIKPLLKNTFHSCHFFSNLVLDKVPEKRVTKLYEKKKVKLQINILGLK